jgi:type II secretory pathway predicted ATPase ExeA
MTPTMDWLTPAVATNVAYAACIILFGMLVLSVRNRKMASKVPYSFYASTLRSGAPSADRLAAGSRTSRSSRRATFPAQTSGLLLNAGLDYKPRERARSRMTESPLTQLSVPLDFPAARTPKEVKMSTEPMMLEAVDSVVTHEVTLAAPEISEVAPEIAEMSASSPAPAMPADPPALPFSLGIADIEERIAGEMAVAPEHSTTHEIAPESAMAAAAGAAGPSSELQAAPAPVVLEKPTADNLLSFYGLQQQPFDVTPDPAYLYFTPSHRAALTSLKEGIEHFRGFMMLVADPGMGKTTLLNRLMEELAESARIVFLFQTQCTSRELLCFILNELEVDHAGMDVVAMHRALNQALLEEMLRGRRFVLVVDEAQNLSEPVLETIRLLSDFETTHSKLIQIVLAGQPQLADSLMRPSLVQLRQRIAALSNLKPLSVTETAEYITHRLRSAGWSGNSLFTSEALETIAELSGGVPRSINNLCFNSLLDGFRNREETISADIVKGVSDKLNLNSLGRHLEPEPVSQPAGVASEAVGTVGATEFARALASAFFAEARGEASGEPFIGPKPNPGVTLTGNVTEKVRSQSWSKRHEYRILVTLEREATSGLAVADHYYCCSIYVDEAMANGLEVGKPVRIKLEQD